MVQRPFAFPFAVDVGSWLRFAFWFWASFGRMRVCGMVAWADRGCSASEHSPRNGKYELSEPKRMKLVPTC